jgi:hypothetical protein
MSRLRLLLLLVTVALAAVAARAQDPEAEPPPPEVDIDSILATEEEMLAGGGYSYEPGERRDPFKSLLSAREPAESRGPRPEGIPGLLIDEIDLTGIFVMPEGPVAQVVSPEQDRSYLLREGDQLYDGDVVRISQDSVVFKQILDDPTALKPFREVQKQLNP